QVVVDRGVHHLSLPTVNLHPTTLSLSPPKLTTPEQSNFVFKPIEHQWQPTLVTHIVSLSSRVNQWPTVNESRPHLLLLYWAVLLLLHREPLIPATVSSSTEV
ncbi:unnamed protein product, partial [Ectocarpus sp. 13 AM-2016]